MPWKQIGLSLTYYHIENVAEYTALYWPETVINEMPLPRIASQRLLPDALRHRLGIAQDTHSAAAFGT